MHFEIPFFCFNRNQLIYSGFSAMFLKAKIKEKATLKAEMAFMHEIQMCSAQKVAYWERELALYCNKQGDKMKKFKIVHLKLSAFGLKQTTSN